MGELNKELFNEALPVGFAFGLSGIGWGIEYLKQNGFTDDDSLEICKEIDKKIMEKDPRRITNYSLELGLEGILHYVIAHIKGVMAHHSKMPFDEIYLHDLYKAVSTIPQNAVLSENFKTLSSNYMSFYKNRKKILNYNMNLSFIIKGSVLEIDKINYAPFGLKNGLAGFLLNKIITTK